VWNYETLDEANAWYWKNEGRGKGISMQLFNIKDKLQELSAGPVPPRLFEAHPELIFRRIAGKVLESKKIDAGRRERIAILKRLGIASIERWLGRRYNTRIGRDDLIHACACAIVARDSKDKLPAGCGHTTMVRNRKSGISWLVV
jgi:predicted RNase H-like nuclease